MFLRLVPLYFQPGVILFNFLRILVDIDKPLKMGSIGENSTYEYLSIDIVSHRL